MSTLTVDKIKTSQGTGFTFNENLNVTGALNVTDTLNVTGNTIQTGLNILRTYIVSTDNQYSEAAGSFNLKVEDQHEQPNLVVVLKPTRADSIFMISVQATAYVSNNYMRWTISRATNASKTGFTAGDTTLNLAHILAGGDGTNTGSHIGRTHASSHSNHGAACIYDLPNTTDYVRYGMVFYEQGTGTYYYPHVGIGTMIIQELNADNTQVSFDAPLITTE